ncbi:MAG: hypothetical protein HUU55_01100 [Myxococcales bacterium]|nr:hypothetical protein [Myxococcales bacterium]
MENISIRRLIIGPFVAVLVVLTSSFCSADDGSMFFQVHAGGGHYFVADDVSLDGVDGGVGDRSSWSGFGLPDIGLNLGSNLGDFLALEIIWDNRHRIAQNSDIYRSDMGLSFGFRSYPLGLGPIASFVGMGAGLSVRNIQPGEPCIVACDSRSQIVDELVRPMLAVGMGVEWYPFGDAVHWLARWDWRWSIETAGGENDLWMSVSIGLGVRLH